MARVTGLEPATSGVTGRRSNQLSYTRLVWRGLYKGWFGLARAFFQKNEALIGLVWSGLVWSGLVWSGLVWSMSAKIT